MAAIRSRQMWGRRAAHLMLTVEYLGWRERRDGKEWAVVRGKRGPHARAFEHFLPNQVKESATPLDRVIKFPPTY